MANNLRKRSLNQNWNMLQSLLVQTKQTFRPQSNYSRRRPQSSKRPPKTLNLSTSSRTDSLSPTKIRSTSMDSKLKSICQTTFHQNLYTIQGITKNQLKKIYEAKCKDLNIPKLPDQQKRFFSYCFKYFQKRKFQMKDSGLGLFSAYTLSSVLKRNSYFSYIVLNKNIFGDQGSLSIMKALKQTLSLVHLDLSSNDISPLGAAQLFNGLTYHQSLVSLDISSHQGLHRNRIALEGSLALKAFLESNKILQILNIEGTSIGPQGLQHIIAGLKSNNQLISLNIANNALGSTKILQLTIAVSQSKLKILNVAQNKLGNDSCVFFASLVKGGYDRMPILQRLNLSRNQISTKGISKIFQGLRNNLYMTDIVLQYNPMPLGLSQMFLQFLLDNSYLRTLNLSYCQLKLEVVYILVEGLGKNGGIVHLNLKHNLIDDTGAQAISFGLAKNSNLKILDLSSNRIKNKGGIALAQALKINSTLEALLIKNNSLKDQAGQLFSEVSRFNHSLLRLELDLNPINLKYIKEIQSNLIYNQQIFKQNQVPKLIAKIDRLRMSDSAVQEVFQQFQKKKKEKNQIEKKFFRQVKRYEAVKQNQYQKLYELQQQLEQLRVKSTNLSELLSQYQNQKKMVEFKNEKIVDNIGNDIAQTVYFIKKQQKNKAKMREDFAMKRIQLQESLQQLEDTLRTVIVAEKSAASSLEVVKQRFQAKLAGNDQGQKQGEKGVKTPAYQESKSYLASEKLATTKKQAKQSPVKESPRPASGRPKQKIKKKK